MEGLPHFRASDSDLLERSSHLTRIESIVSSGDEVLSDGEPTTPRPWEKGGVRRAKSGLTNGNGAIGSLRVASLPSADGGSRFRMLSDGVGFGGLTSGLHPSDSPGKKKADSELSALAAALGHAAAGVGVAPTLSIRIPHTTEEPQGATAANAAGGPSYTLYHIEVSTPYVRYFVYRRYKEFDALNAALEREIAADAKRAAFEAKENSADRQSNVSPLPPWSVSSPSPADRSSVATGGVTSPSTGRLFGLAGPLLQGFGGLTAAPQTPPPPSLAATALDPLAANSSSSSSSFPFAAAASGYNPGKVVLPKLPAKKLSPLGSNLDKTLVEKRRVALQDYLQRMVTPGDEACVLDYRRGGGGGATGPTLSPAPSSPHQGASLSPSVPSSQTSAFTLPPQSLFTGASGLLMRFLSPSLSFSAPERAPTHTAADSQTPSTITNTAPYQQGLMTAPPPLLPLLLKTSVLESQVAHLTAVSRLLVDRSRADEANLEGWSRIVSMLTERIAYMEGLDSRREEASDLLRDQIEELSASVSRLTFEQQQQQQNHHQQRQMGGGIQPTTGVIGSGGGQRRQELPTSSPPPPSNLFVGSPYGYFGGERASETSSIDEEERQSLANDRAGALGIPPPVLGFGRGADAARADGGRSQSLDYERRHSVGPGLFPSGIAPMGSFDVAGIGDTAMERQRSASTGSSDQNTPRLTSQGGGNFRLGEGGGSFNLEAAGGGGFLSGFGANNAPSTSFQRSLFTNNHHQGRSLSVGGRDNNFVGDAFGVSPGRQEVGLTQLERGGSKSITIPAYSGVTGFRRKSSDEVLIGQGGVKSHLSSSPYLGLGVSVENARQNAFPGGMLSPRTPPSPAVGKHFANRMGVGSNVATGPSSDAGHLSAMRGAAPPSNPWQTNSGLSLAFVSSPPTAVHVDCLPFSMVPFEVTDSALDSRLEDILGLLKPSPAAIAHRSRVAHYVSQHIKQTLGAQCFPIGSYACKTYLPDDWLHLSAFLCQGQEATWYIKVNDVLCKAANSAEGLASPQGSEASRHRISNVNFVTEGDTRAIRCTSDGVSVDMTANSIEELYQVAFLEECNLAIGKKHLFKRTLLLLKAWWFYEMRAFSGQTIQACITDFALATLLLSVANRFHSRIQTPLHLLSLFFSVYSKIDWSQNGVNIDGVVDVIDGVRLTQPNLEGNLFGSEFLDSYRKRYGQSRVSASTRSVSSASPGVADGHSPNPVTSSGGKCDSLYDLKARNQSYPVGAMNIVNPLDPGDNLVKSKLSARRAGRFALLIQTGAKNLQPILAHLEKEVERTASGSGLSLYSTSVALVDNFFSTTLGRFGQGWRPDVGAFSDETFRSKSASPAPIHDGSDGRGGSGGAFDDLNRHSGDRDSDDQVWYQEGLDVFDSGLEHLKENLKFCSFLLEKEISQSALSTLSQAVLREKGPMPVGEIGKMLQEATANPSLSAVLKESFGGLKKFLEKFPHLFIISQDHPFNPHVFLRNCFTQDELRQIDAGAGAEILQNLKKGGKKTRRNKNPAGGGGGGGGHHSHHSIDGHPSHTALALLHHHGGGQDNRSHSTGNAALHGPGGPMGGSERSLSSGGLTGLNVASKSFVPRNLSARDLANGGQGGVNR